jgi:hypothetical protein
MTYFGSVSSLVYFHFSPFSFVSFVQHIQIIPHHTASITVAILSTTLVTCSCDDDMETAVQ